MTTLLKNIDNNCNGDYFVIDVHHQLKARGYWVNNIDDANDSDGLSSQLVCETVEELQCYTRVFNDNGNIIRHQAARIATIVGGALNTLFEDGCIPLSNGRLWSDDMTTGIEDYLNNKFGGYHDWTNLPADLEFYADHFDMSLAAVRAYVAEIS